MNKSANRSFSFPVFRPASAAKRIRFLGFLTGLILMLAWAAELLRAESWTDAAGKFTFEADFVGVHAGEVHLKRKADGVTIKVPFQELSAESQQLAKSLQGAPTRPPTAPTSQPSATAGTGHPPAKPVIDPAALLMPIADFLDASTVAVGHVDLTKINLDAALELFHACAPAVPGEDAGVAVVLEGVGELQRQLIQAGVPDVYVVARMDLASAPSPASILLAAPVSAGKDPQAVLEMLSAVSPVPWTVKGNRVLLAFAGELEAWQRIQPRPRQDFLAPLQAAEDTALQLAVIPNADVRRIPLAVAASAGPNTAQESVTGLVTAQQKGQWAVLTATAPPQPAVALILQMEDATAAGTIQGCCRSSRRATSTTRSKPRNFPGGPSCRSMPKASARPMVWSFWPASSRTGCAAPPVRYRLWNGRPDQLPYPRTSGSLGAATSAKIRRTTNPLRERRRDSWDPKRRASTTTALRGPRPTAV